MGVCAECLEIRFSNYQRISLTSNKSFTQELFFQRKFFHQSNSANIKKEHSNQKEPFQSTGAFPNQKCCLNQKSFSNEKVSCESKSRISIWEQNVISIHPVVCHIARNRRALVDGFSAGPASWSQKLQWNAAVRPISGCCFNTFRFSARPARGSQGMPPER